MKGFTNGYRDGSKRILKFTCCVWHSVETCMVLIQRLELHFFFIVRSEESSLTVIKSKYDSERIRVAKKS